MQSKVIVTKCHDEGIPVEVIKNHMSTVSVGLEATIREWFSGSGESESEGGGTAVETAKRVDLSKARAKARPKAARKGDAASEPPTEAESDTSTTVATADAPAAPSAPPAGGAMDDADEPEAPSAKVEPPAQSTPKPAAQQPKSAPRPPAGDESKPTDSASGEPEAGGERPTPGKQVRPAPQNVPTRPKVVTPAGRQLEVKEQVKLSGPRVVRVEAPEPIDTRPRRSPPRGPGGDGFAGPGGPSGPADGPGRDGPGGRGNRRRAPGGQGVPDRRKGRAGGGVAEPGSSSWSQQDLQERQARLQGSGGYLKKRFQQLKNQRSQSRPETPAQKGGKVEISAPFTIKDLSSATGVKSADIVKQLFMQHGIMATPNATIEPERAEEIMLEYAIELEIKSAKTAEEVVSADFEDRIAIDERPRGPVVTILGHVDHGKTSLLDRIRNANVAAGEAGGITQATSAFRVPVKIGDAGDEKQIVFLDTPGHEAFTAMRARGAHVTDIVVLVVAADDGVMPQTIESINHAKASGVPVVVALNKIDKPEATDSNIQRILGQLAEHNLNPVEWGGDTEVVKCSAIKGTGIQELLEVLDYSAELLELKADFGGAARGTVVESRFEVGRGAVANILVQDGALKVGQFIVAGRAFGRVRDITDDRGKRLKDVLPPAPVQISGLDELPDAGDKFYVVDSLKKAQEAAEQRRDRDRHAELSQPKVTLDSLFSKMAESDLKEITIVLKADVQGSVDVLKNEIEKVKTDEIVTRVLHAAVGGITESDVLLAEASRAIIVGFNVIPSGKARKLAESKGVEIRTYKVIYDITDDIKKAAEGLLAPELREEVLGHAEVRAVFKITKVGSVAGCYVTNGVVERDAFIRVTRNDIVIENDRKLAQLKRVKDDAKEVRAGMECGMKIDGYDDIKEGDILECYKQIQVKRTL